MCEMYGDIQVLTTKVDEMYSGPYVLGCLQNVTSTSKLPDVIQEMITELCTAEAAITSLQTQVTNLTTNQTTVIGNFLNTAIQGCQSDSVKKTGSGATFQVTFGGFCPVGSIIMWKGNPAGLFTGGVGNAPGPMCGWNLANGQNGTEDMRGYFPVGVNDGTMGGGSQNAEVDNAVNPGQSYNIGSHGGEIKHQLSNAEVPATPLTGSATSSTPATVYVGDQIGFKTSTSGNNGISYPPGIYGGPTPPHNAVIIPVTAPTVSLTTGSVNGGGGKHENRPPYKAVYFIQRMF